MSLSAEALKSLSAEEALNINIDELPEVGFKIWPDGTYNIIFNEPEMTEVGADKKPRLGIKYVLENVIELADPEATEPAAESVNSLGYMLPVGAANMKADFKDIFEATGSKTILELAQQLEGYKGQITLGHRPDKNDKDRVYQTVKALVPQV